MSSVPGKVGWPVVGETSYSFYKDPIDFIEQHMKSYDTRVFKTRFLTKPTVFVGSNQGVQDVLSDDTCALELGYKSFMHEIYGDNILFLNGEEGSQLRLCLSELFTDDSIKSYRETADRITARHLEQLDISEPLCVYTFFKRLCTEICLSLFLDLDFPNSEQLATDIVSLTTTHWHGIISVPLSLKLPMGSASNFSKALDAKGKLLHVIQEKLKGNNGFSKKMESLSFPQDVYAPNHLLLFTSALVPKAVASLLTSFVIATGHQDQVSCQDHLLTDPSLMENVLLEVQRLYPPFIGGRRLVRKTCAIDGYRVSEGQAIVYLTYSAHRDPAIFDQPEKFSPDRWKHSKAEDREKLFCFGGGSRECIGQTFVWSLINTIIKRLLTDFRWMLLEGQDTTPKWLPVSRPKETIAVQLRRKGDTTQ